MGARHSTTPSNSTHANATSPHMMTIYGHLLYVNRTRADVDTIVRTTGGKQEAIQFMVGHLWDVEQQTPAEAYALRPNVERLRADERRIITSAVAFRIALWTPEAEQARREALLEQMRRESTTTPAIQLSIVSETKTNE